MEIGLFCFHYSDISGNQAFYQSPCQHFTTYLKFESIYYATNHQGLFGTYVFVIDHIGHVSFTWQTIRTRTSVLLSGWCSFCEVDGCARAQNLSSPTRTVRRKPPATQAPALRGFRQHEPS